MDEPPVPGSPPGARVGRPRDPGVDAAVLTAALDLVGEVGLRGVSLDSIAKRAGVATTTVYRRYSSTDDVLVALMDQVYRESTIPDTGTVRGDLVTFMERINDVWTDRRRASFAAALVTAMVDNPAVASALQAALEAQRVRTRRIIDRAKARGELRQDTDADLVLDLLSGVLAQRVLFRQLPPAPADAVVDILLDGVLGGTSRPPPGDRAARR